MRVCCCRIVSCRRWRALSSLSTENPGDLFDRAPADIGDDDHPGPIGDHAGDRIGCAEPEHLVPDDHFPEIDDHWRGEQRPDDGGVPPALLRNDDCGGVLSRLDLGREFHGGSFAMLS